MDNFSFIYLINRALYRIGDFFHHWYYDGSRNFARTYIATLERLDRTFAVSINFHFLFQPLYKDFTVVGTILGPIFRGSRVLIGFTVYAFFTVIFVALYIIWLLLPPALILYAVRKY
jgi:hypothetical protein